jgi:hypothetical protein
MTMRTDRLAVQVAIKTCNRPEREGLRVVRIKNTLHLDHILISEALLGEARAHPQISIEGSSEPWPFDQQGNLPDIGQW